MYTLLIEKKLRIHNKIGYLSYTKLNSFLILSIAVARQHQTSPSKIEAVVIHDVIVNFVFPMPRPDREMDSMG